MEALQTVIQRLSVPSSNINVEIIQEVLIATKKASIQNEEYEEFNIILEMLWDHLKTGLEEFDDQLLCSTCFYNVLNKSTKQEFYLNQILIIINDELEINEKNHDNISLATTLCYGLFQSSYLANDLKNTAVLENTMKSIFKLLVRMSYEYTQYTFIAFKTMSSFKKVIGTSLEMTIFSNENKIKMLHVINNNWENPITGIRNLNRILFQTLLQVINDDVLTQIIREINKFYWNKAKYLMLTEVILKYSGNIVDYVLKNMWLGGLLNSLYKPGLVSAGADMYYAILEKLNSENCWTTLFLEPVIELLTGASFQAIENFKNYWCLNTFKKFPTLAKDLVQHLKLASDSELKLYSILCVLKQANKLALIERKWTTASHNSNEQLVLTSIDHCNAFIRMTAFEITCVSHQKCLPTQIEYEQILNYLRDNINSDCTVLRLCMINSLDSFLTQLHTNFMNIVNDEGLSPMKCFFKSLQSFIIESLSLYGNYQRKITTIKVLYTIFNSLSGKSKKKNKKQNCSSKPTLLTFLKENNCWEFDNADFILKLMSLLKDPANDVHENVLQLLCNYYLNDFNNSNLFICLVEEGLTCVKSKFFYEICSGHNIFKLIVNVLIETNTFINKEVNFKTIIDVFQFAYKEIDCGSYSKENIVKSIIEGRQLHAYLGILFVIFDASLKTGFKIPIDYEGIIKLVDVLEIISNQFAWEEDTLTSSDFSKMSDMVQTLINNSEYAEENNQDQTKISGFHQIVLNCLWLNVKAACDLASLLILYCKEYVEVCEKCLHIIMHVLETSRHKGAIEAAGAALGQGINYLTSTKLSPEVSQLPFILLKKKLNELLYETAKMSSVTRRGAGLSIMVHRIVSNDRKKGKPLFHYFMVELLTTCKSLDKNCEVEESDKDLPKAIYIHFLTRIVTDSSLASDIMYYSADLAELAFDNLTNSNWQIRNAALQLYGALIPKLIGQKKASGIDEETVATVACDEFLTHSPKLWKYIVKEINNNQSNDIIQTHSNLVPILNVLANIARRYNFSCDVKEQSSLELDLLKNLTLLLGSPIYTVRRLAAKSITNLFCFDIVYDFIKTNNNDAENHIHGCIMLLSELHKIYSTEETLRTQLNELINNLNNKLLQGNYFFICRWGIEMLLQTENAKNITVELMQEIFLHTNANRYKPGVALWEKIKVQKYLQEAPLNVIPCILKIILACNEYENYLDILINRLETSDGNGQVTLEEIAYALLSSDLKLRSSNLWKILYLISLKTDLNCDMTQIMFLNTNLFKISFQMRYMIPFATRLCVTRGDNYLSVLSNIIQSLCNPETNDIDLRYIAAISNNELSHKFKSHNENVKINAIISAIILLQDEDEDVRNVSVAFYKNVVNDKNPKQPFVCLNAILDIGFLSIMLNQPKISIPKICTDLLSFIDGMSQTKGDEYNPFASDTKNVYFEVNVLRQILFKLNKYVE